MGRAASGLNVIAGQRLFRHFIASNCGNPLTLACRAVSRNIGLPSQIRGWLNRLSAFDPCRLHSASCCASAEFSERSRPILKHVVRTLVLLTSPLLSACLGQHTARPQSPTECPRVPEANAARTDSVPLARLTGRFRIVQIDTVREDQPPRRFFVELRLLDSASIATLVREDERVRAFFKSRPPLEIFPLVGSQPGVTQPWRGDQRGLLAWSCWPTECADEVSTRYRFRFVGSRDIRGVWGISSWGIASGVDPKTGRRIPLPAGIFCMTPA